MQTRPSHLYHVYRLFQSQPSVNCFTIYKATDFPKTDPHYYAFGCRNYPSSFPSDYSVADPRMRLAEENMSAHHHLGHMTTHHQGATHHHPHAHAPSIMHSMSAAIPNGHSMIPTDHDMSRKYCISPTSKLMDDHQGNMTLNLVKTEVTPLHYFGGHLDHTVASM